MSALADTASLRSTGDYHIHSGDCHVTDDADLTISTVLGSCISVCARDTVACVGGMNHFLLPEASQTQDGASARYGAYAMEMLINGILKLGGRRDRLECKVFGGSDIGGFSTKIGAANCTFIKTYLGNEGLSIAAIDTGGTQARRVRYCPGTGVALVRSVSDNAADVRRVNADELSLSARIAASIREHDNDIELF